MFMVDEMNLSRSSLLIRCREVGCWTDSVVVNALPHEDNIGQAADGSSFY